MCICTYSIPCSVLSPNTWTTYIDTYCVEIRNVWGEHSQSPMSCQQSHRPLLHWPWPPRSIWGWACTTGGLPGDPWTSILKPPPQRLGTVRSAQAGVWWLCKPVCFNGPASDADIPRVTCRFDACSLSESCSFFTSEPHVQWHHSINMFTLSGALWFHYHL